jgi:hypothetical protein
MMFSQHSAELSICWLGVQYVCSCGRLLVCLGGPSWRFQGSSYLLSTVSIILENGGEKFQFLDEGVLVTESCGSVYQGNED